MEAHCRDLEMLYIDFKKQQQQLIRLAELPPVIWKNDEHSWWRLARKDSQMHEIWPHLYHRLPEQPCTTRINPSLLLLLFYERRAESSVNDHPADSGDSTVPLTESSMQEARAQLDAQQQLSLKGQERECQPTHTNPFPNCDLVLRLRYQYKCSTQLL